MQPIICMKHKEDETKYFFFHTGTYFDLYGIWGLNNGIYN